MHCAICNHSIHNKTHTFREMMFGLREAFDYIECSTCKAIQIITVPQNMERHYPDNYYSLHQSPVRAYSHPIRAYLERARTRYAVFGKSLLGKLMFTRYPDGAPGSLVRIPNLTKETSILDVGCGSGKLLYDLKEIGFTDVHGTDPYLKSPIYYENGLTIEHKMVKDLEGTFDVIMLHHVFEHIPNPKELLDQLRDKLEENGTIIIRIPVADCAAWRMYGSNWVQLDAPRHFFLHTPASIDILAGQTGLEIEEIVYDSTAFQFWGSELYKQDIPLMSDQSPAVDPKVHIFTKDQIQNWATQATMLNASADGDQACFYLKKK